MNEDRYFWVTYFFNDLDLKVIPGNLPIVSKSRPTREEVKAKIIEKEAEYCEDGTILNIAFQFPEELTKQQFQAFNK